jgi:hypothetical protein
MSPQSRQRLLEQILFHTKLKYEVSYSRSRHIKGRMQSILQLPIEYLVYLDISSQLLHDPPTIKYTKVNASNGGVRLLPVKEH